LIILIETGKFADIIHNLNINL